MAAPLTTTWIKSGCVPLPATHQMPVSQARVHPGLTHAARGQSGSLPPRAFGSAAGSCHVACLAAFPGRKAPGPPALFSTGPC